MGNKCCGANSSAPSTKDISKSKKLMRKKSNRKDAVALISRQPVSSREKHYIATNENFEEMCTDPDEIARQRADAYCK